MTMPSGAATLEAQSDDDGGYISPEFDLPDLPTDEEEEMAAPPSKKSKFASFSSKPIGIKSTYKDSLDDEEELALRLLGRR